MQYQNKIGIRLFHILNYFILTLFCILCIYPFYYVFINSISSPEISARGIVQFYPIKPTLQNYIQIMKLEGLSMAFVVSTMRVVIGTFLSVFLSSLFAFILSHKDVPFSKFMYRVTIASMYLNAGLIPYFLTMRSYGLQNNFLVYVLPGAISAYFVLLVKVYIEQLPSSLEESAIIDGAGYILVYLKIILPLIVPVLAAISVFSAVGQWNSWFDNMIFVTDLNLQTLQYMLWRYFNQAEEIAQSVKNDPTYMQMAKDYTLTPTAIRLTITMVVTIPIIMVYPFLQRFFIKGILLGAVKG